MATQTQEFKLVSKGTVLDYTGNKGVIKFSERNLKGTARIVVRLFNKKNVELKVWCSQGVSDGLRNKTIARGNLPTLELMEDTERNITYICLPESADVVVNVADLDIRAMDVEEVDMENFLAL